MAATMSRSVMFLYPLKSLKRPIRKGYSLLLNSTRPSFRQCSTSFCITKFSFHVTTLVHDHLSRENHEVARVLTCRVTLKNRRSSVKKDAVFLLAHNVIETDVHLELLFSPSVRPSTSPIGKAFLS